MLFTLNSPFFALIPLSIHRHVEGLQHHRARRHYERARREESHAAFCAHLLEDRVRVEAVVLGAAFDPGPVQEGESAGQGKGLGERDGPWRGEEEEVRGQEEGREGVEGQIGGEGQLGPGRDDEVTIYEPEGPVKDADEDFERGGAYRDCVFEPEKEGGGG